MASEVMSLIVVANWSNSPRVSCSPLEDLDLDHGVVPALRVILQRPVQLPLDPEQRFHPAGNNEDIRLARTRHLSTLFEIRVLGL